MKTREPSEQCKEVFAALSEYLDMELSPASCEELEAHLAGCPPCIKFVESLRKSIGLCHRYSLAEPPKPLSKDARHELQAAYRKMLAAREYRDHL